MSPEAIVLLLVCGIVASLLLTVWLHASTAHRIGNIEAAERLGVETAKSPTADPGPRLNDGLRQLTDHEWSIMPRTTHLGMELSH